MKKSNSSSSDVVFPDRSGLICHDPLKECTEEQLLEFVSSCSSGESADVNPLVRSHLSVCRSCRLKLKEVAYRVGETKARRDLIARCESVDGNVRREKAVSQISLQGDGFDRVLEAEYCQQEIGISDYPGLIADLTNVVRTYGVNFVDMQASCRVESVRSIANAEIQKAYVSFRCRGSRSGIQSLERDLARHIAWLEKRGQLYAAEFSDLVRVSSEHAYSVCITGQDRRGIVDDALGLIYTRGQFSIAKMSAAANSRTGEVEMSFVFFEPNNRKVSAFWSVLREWAADHSMLASWASGPREASDLAANQIKAICSMSSRHDDCFQKIASQYRVAKV